MTHPLFIRLAAFRRRYRWRSAVFGLCLGTLLAAVVAGLFLFLRLPTTAVGVLVGVPVLALLVGLILPRRWPAVAAGVDEAAGLDDRLTAAVEYAALADPKPIHELQLRDATTRLNAVPLSAVPVRPPRGWWVGGFAYALLVGLLIGGVGRPVVASPPAENVLRAADLLDKLADELDEDAIDDSADDLKQLAAKMRATAAECRQPGTDPATAMAKVSALQQDAVAKLAATAEQALKDQEGLKKIGSAMQSAGPLREAGQALQKGQYGRASRALAGMKPGTKFDPKEARTAAEDLKKVANELSAEKLPDLSRPAEKLSKGLSGDAEQLKQGSEDLQRKVHEQERRARINLTINRLQRALARCKELLQQRNLMGDEKGKQGDNKKAAPSANSSADEESLRQKLEDPKYREQFEKMLKKLESQVERLEEEAGSDPNQPGATGPRRSAPRDPNRRFDQQIEEALLRERIPVQYHTAVRAYFKKLADAAGPETKP